MKTKNPRIDIKKQIFSLFLDEKKNSFIEIRDILKEKGISLEVQEVIELIQQNIDSFADNSGKTQEKIINRLKGFLQKGLVGTDKDYISFLSKALTTLDEQAQKIIDILDRKPSAYSANIVISLLSTLTEMKKELEIAKGEKILSVKNIIQEYHYKISEIISDVITDTIEDKRLRSLIFSQLKIRFGKVLNEYTEGSLVVKAKGLP